MKSYPYSVGKALGVAGLLGLGVGAAWGADEKTVPGVGLVLEHIPAGNFTMGNPDHPAGYKVDETPHAVTISQDFWLGKTEVTQGQWNAVMNTTITDQAKLALADDTVYVIENRAETVETVRQFFHLQKDSEPNSGRIPMVGNMEDNYPIYWVNQHDAEVFCHKLTLREQAAGRLGDEYVYTLPTEAQWEYACRAGTTTATYAGPMDFKGRDDAPVLQNIAWYGGNSAEGYTGRGWNTRGWYEAADLGGIAGPRIVATKKPNAWGLNDMLGNMQEWTLDWYAPYPKDPVTDPLVLAGTISVAIVRGGSWQSAVFECEAGFRSVQFASYRWADLGFRVALVHKRAPGT
jgi:formylglycine-generating enzyme required for sulfatase activity